jgi:transposase-like protein
MNKTKTEAGKGAGVDVRLIDQWLAEHYEHPQDILGKEGLLAQLTKAVVERALSAELTPFYDYPPEIRKMIYTTNAIESLNMPLRKVLKNRGHFPSEAAASKLIYLALRNIVKQWKKPPTHWGAAAHQFALKFGERFISSPSATEKR